MKIFFISILIFLTSCMVKDGKDEVGFETIPNSFPRNYKNFFAGMSEEQLFENAAKEYFYIKQEISEWKRDSEGDIIGPKLIFRNEGVQLTAYNIDKKIAKLEFEGDYDPLFSMEIDDIYDSFEVKNHNRNTKTFYQDSLKTHIDKSNDVLVFTHRKLWKKWRDSKIKFKEELKSKIQKKYSYFVMKYGIDFGLILI